MFKLFVIVVLITALITIIAYFFGLRSNKNNVTKTFVGLSLLGGALPIGSVIYYSMNEPSLGNIVLCMFAYLIGIIILCVSPVLASAIGLATGKPFKGPYQKMSPNEKETFWNGVRFMGKLVTSWYARDQRRKGNHASADAAKYANKVL